MVYGIMRHVRCRYSYMFIKIYVIIGIADMLPSNSNVRLNKVRKIVGLLDTNRRMNKVNLLDKKEVRVDYEHTFLTACLTITSIDYNSNLSAPLVMLNNVLFYTTSIRKILF